MNKGFFPATIFLLGLLWGCSESKSDYQQLLEKEKAYLASADSAARLNRPEIFESAAESYYQTCMTFVKEHPEESKVPEILFGAGEAVLQGKEDPLLAISCFERILREYPESNAASHAMFMEAYVYHNFLIDLPKAKAKYTLFIKKYPDHELVVSAQAELDEIGY